MRSTALLFAGLLLWMCAGCGQGTSSSKSGSSGAKTWTVDGTGKGDFASIKDAAEAALDGDILLIKPGTYTHAVTITKPLTLRGDGVRTAVILQVSEPCAVLVQADTKFENLTIRQSSLNRKDGQGVDVVGGSVSFVNCALSAQSSALTLRPQTKAELKKTSVTNCENYGVSADSAFIAEDCDFTSNQMGGVAINTPLEVSIKNCRFVGNGLGLRIQGPSRQTTIENNSITNSRYHAIHIENKAHATIRGNRITDNGESGIFITDFAHATVEKNTISGTGKTNNNAAIYCYSSQNVVVTGNTIKAVFKGISSYGTGEPQIVDNDITGCEEYAIDVRTKAMISRCRIYKNKGNPVYVSDDGTAKVEDCDIYENDLSILVHSLANAVLRNNKIHDNPSNRGIVVRDEASVELTSNEIFNNGLSGVEFSGKSRAEMKGNKIYDNKQFGIEFLQDSGGNVTENDLLKNKFGSLYTDSTVLANLKSSGNKEEKATGAKVRAGDWFLCEQVTRKDGKLETVQLRYTVVSVDATQYTLDIQQMPDGKPQRETREVITGKYDFETRQGIDIRRMQSGQSIVMIGGKPIACDWEKFEIDAMDKKEKIQVWSSSILPFVQYIKREHTATVPTLSTTQIKPLDFQAEQYTPPPKK